MFPRKSATRSVNVTNSSLSSKVALQNSLLTVKHALYARPGALGKGMDENQNVPIRRRTNDFSLFDISSNSVKCAACQKNYHMSCLNPPLSRKPPKGFAWQCAFCSRKDIPQTPEDGLGTKVKHGDNTTSKKESSGEKSAGDTKSRRPTRMTRAQLGRTNSSSNSMPVATATPPQSAQPSQQSAKVLKQTEIKLKLLPKASRKGRNRINFLLLMLL